MAENNVFLSDLINLYNEVIPIELEVLLGLITDKHSLNNIRSTEGKMLMTETKLQ